MIRSLFTGTRAGVLLALVGSLVLPGSVAAAVRYAEPNGNGPEPCLESDPCSFPNAVSAPAVVNNDEVVLLTGDYPLGSTNVIISDDIDVHGQAGQARPRLLSSAAGAFLSLQGAGADNASLHDFEIVHSASGTALSIGASNVTAERLVVTASGFGACSPSGNGDLIRDTICRNTGTGGAVNLNTSGGSPRTIALRNVTAVATEGTGTNRYGIHLTANNGAHVTFDARNVIAEGATADVRADHNMTGSPSAAVTLASSNYDSESESGAAASITDPGSGDNQTAPPLLADLAGGDFHQLAGSPTIDAGTTDPLLGTSDLDGDARTLGSAPDIGADEFVPPPPPPSPDTDPPETTITKEPKNRTESHRARFRFVSDEPGSTFQCKLDKRPFKPCSSPKRYRGLRVRRHGFRVRAIDPAGNADPTADRDRWRVLATR